MFLRVDKLQIELPAPAKQDPSAGAALQELLGGKYGEMSTLGNYLFQSFNFRSKSKLRPFYGIVAAITAEELGHVELVSNGVAMLNKGPDSEADTTSDAVLGNGDDDGYLHRLDRHRGRYVRMRTVADEIEVLEAELEERADFRIDLHAR